MGIPQGTFLPIVPANARPGTTAPQVPWHQLRRRAVATHGSVRLGQRRRRLWRMGTTRSAAAPAHTPARHSASRAITVLRECEPCALPGSTVTATATRQGSVLGCVRQGTSALKAAPQALQLPAVVTLCTARRVVRLLSWCLAATTAPEATTAPPEPAKWSARLGESEALPCVYVWRCTCSPRASCPGTTAPLARSSCAQAACSATPLACQCLLAPSPVTQGGTVPLPAKRQRRARVNARLATPAPKAPALQRSRRVQRVGTQARLRLRAWACVRRASTARWPRPRTRSKTVARRRSTAQLVLARPPV